MQPSVTYRALAVQLLKIGLSQQKSVMQKKKPKVKIKRWSHFRKKHKRSSGISVPELL